MLSILIVNWNTRDLLKKCLASIYQFPPNTSYEIIVVDNDSSDGSCDMVKREFPAVILLGSNINAGYADGNNLAFNISNGDLLLTLNPDTEFETLSLNKALEELSNKQDYGVLSIQLRGIDNNIQKSIRGFPTIFGIFGAWTKLDRVFPVSLLGQYSLPSFDYEHSGPAPQPMGTFLLFKRQALDAVGDSKAPFDPQFPIFFNEVDLLYRLHQAGWPCWYCADAFVKHHHGASTKQVRKSMIWESHKSLIRYFKKHQKGVGRVVLPFLTAVAYVSAFIRTKGYDPGFRPQHHNL